MSLTSGSRLGVHEVIGLLGAGGMGEVYRAHDTRLNRQVAIKILPEAYASDPDRVARFHREAQAVAALNHTSIAGIYELAEDNGIKYLVLELIEGDTLADRLRRGPLPVTEALAIAKQILDALEVAHEKGICHRDLKPANIKLTPDGAVKVLDFGLAKFLQSAPSAGHLTHSPTLSLAGTYPGVVLGTAGYMSPEQAKGFEADQRSDVFSFGCILFEMLTGRQAFEGETASEILAAVLKSDVDLTLLPPRLNPRLIELLKRCLEKNPKKRWHAVADVRVELETAASHPVIAESARAAATQPLWKRIAGLSVATLAGAALAGYLAWTLKPEPPRALARFAVPLAEGQNFTNAGRRLVAISPDGTNLVYVASNSLQLRTLATLDTRLVTTAPGAAVASPAFSPDGQSIAFAVVSTSSVQIKRVALTGGAPVTICTPDATFGLSWGPEGIVFGRGPNGVARVAAEGGTPEVIATVEGDEMAGSPQILPDGKTLLFTVKKSTEPWERGQIVTQPLAGGARKVHVTGGADGRYLPSGHLIYMLSGVVLAVPFDLDQLAVTGGPVPVVEGVRRAVSSQASGSMQLDYSQNGSLVYVPGPVNTEATGTDLAYFDRTGGNQPLKLPIGAYRSPRVSADGKWLTFDSEDERDAIVWVYALAGTGSIRRLTFGGKNRAPVWSPDGQWIAYQSDRDGDVAIFRQRADGSGPPERLTKPEPGEEHIPQSWAPNGQHLLFTVRKNQQYSLWTLTLADRRRQPFADVQSTALIEAVFSPDGRWVAHQNRSAAGNEVLVQPFPATGAKYLLPQQGAGHPMWSPKGDEMVVNFAPGQSAVLSVTTSPQFAFGVPAPFARTGRAEPNPATDRRNIDFMPDGQRTVGVLSQITNVGGNRAENAMIVVLNWFDELRQRVPAKK